MELVLSKHMLILQNFVRQDIHSCPQNFPKIFVGLGCMKPCSVQNSQMIEYMNKTPYVRYRDIFDCSETNIIVRYCHIQLAYRHKFLRYIYIWCNPIAMDCQTPVTLNTYGHNVVISHESSIFDLCYMARFRQLGIEQLLWNETCFYVWLSIVFRFNG